MAIYMILVRGSLQEKKQARRSNKQPQRKISSTSRQGWN